LAAALMPVNVRPRAGAAPEPLVMFICASTEGGMTIADPKTASNFTDECWSQAVGRFALDPHSSGDEPLNYLPARVLLAPALASARDLIAETLTPLGVVVEVSESTPNADEGLDALAEALENRVDTDGEFVDRDDEHGEAGNRGKRGESLLVMAQGLASINGVTADRIAAFAKAAVLFLAAKPWTMMHHEIVWRIEPAPQEKAQRYCTVMGGGGQEFGIAFLSSRTQAQDISTGSNDGNYAMDPNTTYWSVMFNAVHETPKADVFWWKKHRLVLASTDMYPVPIGMKRGAELFRPTAAGLTFFESLLRTFSGLTVAEVERGRIVREVSAFGGARTITLIADAAD